MGVVGLAENIATQPSLAGAWAEFGKIYLQKFQLLRKRVRRRITTFSMSANWIRLTKVGTVQPQLVISKIAELYQVYLEAHTFEYGYLKLCIGNTIK